MGVINKVQNRMPGVTLKLRNASLGKTESGMLVGKAELIGHVNDKEVWLAVVQELNGLRIFSSTEVKDEMITALGMELEESETELDKVKAELAEAQNKIARLNDFLTGVGLSVGFTEPEG